MKLKVADNEDNSQMAAPQHWAEREHLRQMRDRMSLAEILRLASKPQAAAMLWVCRCAKVEEGCGEWPANSDWGEEHWLERAEVDVELGTEPMEKALRQRDGRTAWDAVETDVGDDVRLVQLGSIAVGVEARKTMKGGRRAGEREERKYSLDVCSHAAAYQAVVIEGSAHGVGKLSDLETHIQRDLRGASRLTGHGNSGSDSPRTTTWSADRRRPPEQSLRHARCRWVACMRGGGRAENRYNTATGGARPQTPSGLSFAPWPRQGPHLVVCPRSLVRYTSIAVYSCRLGRCADDLWCGLSSGHQQQAKQCSLVVVLHPPPSEPLISRLLADHFVPSTLASVIRDPSLLALSFLSTLVLLSTTLVRFSGRCALFRQAPPPVCLPTARNPPILLAAAQPLPEPHCPSQAYPFHRTLIPPELKSHLPRPRGRTASHLLGSRRRLQPSCGFHDRPSRLSFPFLSSPLCRPEFLRAISFPQAASAPVWTILPFSTKNQTVKARLQVSAYGVSVYNKEFDPCDNTTKVEQLCPVPAGHFEAKGTQKIPQEYASMIPGIAYTIPDLDGAGKLELISDETGKDLGCIQSTLTNDKTAEVPGASYAAVGIAGAAFVVSGLGAIAAVTGGHGAPGSSVSSPSFVEVMHWFQGMAMNGMLSVQYPSIYRSFTRNFGFSTGLVPWDSVQTRIDSFRASTGGNLTHDSVEWLRNSTLVYQTSTTSGLAKRALLPSLIETAILYARDGVDVSVDGQNSTVGDSSTGSASSNTTNTGNDKQMNYVQGIQGYVEQLKIPQANTFMTVLLVFSIILAAIAAGILLFKVILEAWALFGSFPKKLTSFRKNYWWLLAKTLTNLILLLYGVWTLYCVYQFKQGDSWAAKTLAAVTLGLFTAILLGFTWRIYHLAHKFKKAEGDASQLFEDKETWRKYSIFYDTYKRSYWWLFVPAIIYMFAKGCVIAGADGHGLAQTAGQLIVESIMLLMLLFIRPYNLKSGNWINITIQVVRVISVICILIFVEELGFSQTTQTITGLVLIVTQSVLTGVLAILIAVNAIVNCVRMNPHRRKRKEQEKFHRDFDALTPLDARNSLLMYPMDRKGADGKAEMVSVHTRGASKNGYDMVPLRDESNDRLVSHGAGMASQGSLSHDRSRSISPDPNHRQPQLPDLQFMGRALEHLLGRCLEPYLRDLYIDASNNHFFMTHTQSGLYRREFQWSLRNWTNVRAKEGGLMPRQERPCIQMRHTTRLMPPKSKKKKPASNPARGFATTSIASKPKPERGNDAPSTAPASGDATPSKGTETPATTGTQSTTVETSAPSERPMHELSPDELEQRLEEGELQAIVDKFATKSLRDATRHVTKIQTDCRLLRASATPVSWRGLLNETLTSEILALAQADAATGRLDSVEEPERRRLKEEDAVARLWTLRRTLLALGFSPQLVTDALKFVLRFPPEAETSGLVWGLDQCLDWLVLNAPESELPAYDSTTGKVRKVNEDLNSLPLPVIDPPGQFSSSQDWKADKATQQAKEDVPPEKDDLEVSDLDSDMEPDEILSKWLTTKARIYEARPDLFEDGKSKTRKKGPKAPDAPRPLSSGVRKLQQNLAQLESDVLFDCYDAEDKWIKQRNQLAQEMADKRRAEFENPISQPESSRPSSKDSTPEPSSNGKASHPMLGEIADEDDEYIGGIFGEAVEQAEAQAAELSERAAVDTLNVRLRSMPQWKGMTPRRVFEETCRARDSGVKISFKLVSISAWSNRHAITISWSKPQSSTLALDTPEFESLLHPRQVHFTMKTIACSNEHDSEAYVSTFALFQVFSLSSKEDKVYLRLPATWRDVYLEFAEESKEQNGRVDREVVREIRDVVRGQAEEDEDEDVINTKGFAARNLERNQNRSEEKESSGVGSTSEETQRILQAIWADKSSTAAYQNMLQSRNTLPMAQFKPLCLETVSKNQVTILCGETGCGKSTQMPAFILENELTQGRPCKIYCTEPRRISAITLAQRVSQEMGEPKNACGTSRSLVGYAIRLESNVTSTTRLVFATTGIVLRMLESKDGFADITHIVVDEVHERSIETDFLLIILRRLLVTRPSLKVILMSATVDAQRFSDYFSGAPVLNVPGRTFPVETRFLEDAIELTGYKIEGDNEKSVDEDDDVTDGASVPENADAKNQYFKDYSKSTRAALAQFNEYRIDYGLIASLIAAISNNPLYSQTGYGRAILVFLPGLAEIRQMSDLLLGSGLGKQYDIHQLHSTIASEDQQLAFEYPAHGRGKIVLSTNIAETGVTIPDITCVIDTGKHKEMRFEERRQVSRLLESFISRANAKQRRGRAGRVQKGLCFHLFTKYRHDTLMASQQTPEMLRLSLQDLIMRVKITKLGDIQTALSSALDPPAPKNIRRAIDTLIEVGALTSSEDLTSLGHQISKLPLDPYLGKLVLYGTVYGCLEVTLTIAAILTSKSPFVSPVGARKQADLARVAFKKADSDLLTEYNAYAAWKRVCTDSSTSEFQFCRKNLLSPQTLANIEDLKGQLFSALRDTGLLAGISKDPPSAATTNGPRRGRKFVHIPAALTKHSSLSSPLVTGLIAWALYPKILARDPNTKHSFRSIATNQAIALHPTSLPRLAPPSSPTTTALVSYYSVVQASGGARNYNASGVTPVHALVLLLGPAGEARFDGVAGAVILDGARLRLLLGEGTPAGWRVLTAIKFLRRRIEECLRKKWSGAGRGRDAGWGTKLGRWWAMWEKVVEAWEADAKSREERRLLPHTVHANQTAQRTRQTNKAIVQERRKAQSQAGNRDIAGIAQQLQIDSSALPLERLLLDDALALLGIDARGALPQLEQLVQPGDGIERQPGEPKAVGNVLHALGLLLALEAADARQVQEDDVVDQHVARVAQLAADGAVAQQGRGAGGLGRGVVGLRGGLDVLDDLAQAHGFADHAELRLDGGPGRDGRRWVVRAQEVPGVEAREVLQRAHELLAANCGEGVGLVAGAIECGCGEGRGVCGEGGKRRAVRTGRGDELEVVADRRVVDNCVGNHDCECVRSKMCVRGEWGGQRHAPHPLLPLLSASLPLDFWCMSLRRLCPTTPLSLTRRHHIHLPPSRSRIMANVATSYDGPVRIAVIGGTGLQSLPGFTLVATLNPTTPWGTPSSPISILHHPSPSGGAPVPVAFISRHGLHHQFAPHEVPARANIAALRKLGVRSLVAFSAVGSLQEHIKPRDFVVPDQIIDRTKGIRPFTFFEGGMVGHHMFADPFDNALGKVVRTCGHALAGDGVILHDEGTLICMEGPQFSTRAESKLYRAWGGSVINMSALPEAKLAREAEISYQMICMSTDYDCWHPSGDVTVEMVMSNMKANADNARLFVGAVLDELSKEEYKDLVEAKHFEGHSKFAGSMTGPEGRSKEALEKLEWLFPGYFK
ncbi:hypothetical protein FH972_023034 [Carpinus fangiana]|uniref:S-methyl-5'-thioadenosine phosphorylase n=1 Tax=Carpinus fangiana TaxID=176857 RepID=A0A5N6KUB0_9ROSI|nr:hypothetical protein FH972_023034 [Carpinus fangiana]